MFYSPLTNGNSSLFNDSDPLNKMNNNKSETYSESVNVFSSEDNKHTYSFEKQYYTRSIEFSDYLRTDYSMTEPIVNYFLNDSRDHRKEIVGATIPLWTMNSDYDSKEPSVPAAVAGVVYESVALQHLLFENFMQENCDHITCRNLCSQKRKEAMNLTCYLVDEHGIVVLSTQAPSERFPDKIGRSREHAMGQPLYKVRLLYDRVLLYYKYRIQKQD